MPSDERRRYPRLKANVFCQEVGAWVAGPKRKAIDISAGGIRVFSDDPHEIGQRLELNVFLPDGETVTVPSLVAWVEALPAGGPAAYDVGLQFVDIAPEVKDRLAALLEPLPG